MNDRQAAINNYDERIETLSTNIEMLSKRKEMSNDVIKVTNVIGGAAPVVSAAVAVIANRSVSEIAFSAIFASVLAVGGVYATKKRIESDNKEIDFKISDNLRDMDRLSNKKSLLEQGMDDEVILRRQKRTM